MISLMRKVFPSHKSQIVKKNVKDEAVNPRVVKGEGVVYRSRKFQSRVELENKKILDFLKKPEEHQSASLSQKRYYSSDQRAALTTFKTHQQRERPHILTSVSTPWGKFFLNIFELDPNSESNSIA